MAVKKIGTLNKHQNPATNENEFDIENYMNVNWDKIKEVVDNNADELATTQGKVTVLETDNTKNKQDVSDIKAEQEVQNDLLQRTQSALINIKTEKSSNINVKDSSNLNAKIGVFGISEQETRSGKNKLKLINSNNTSAGLNWQTTEDEVKISGTATSGYSSSNEFECPTIPAGTYKFLAGGVSNLTYRIWLYNNQNQLIKYPASGEKFTLTEDVVKYRLIFDNLTTGNTYNASFKPMILESTEEDETFEQYGASPSPDFPSQIENVTGNIDITVCNKNLLDLTKCGFNNCVKNKDGSVRSNINNDYYATITTSQLNDFILQNKGKSLTFSFEGISTKAIGFYIPCKRANSDSDYFETTKTGNSITMQIPEDLESLSYIQIRWNRQSTTFTDTTTVINNIQLELNNAKTDFVEHKEQLITFPLAQGQKLADGDYLASDGIHYVRDVYIFKAVTSLSSYNNNKYGTNVGAVNSINTSNILSDRIVGSSSTEENTGYITGNGETVVIYGNQSDTVESFNEKFVGTKIEYPLAKEKIEAYTPEQQEAYNQLQNAQSYYNVTNVFTDNAQLVFKYIADTQTWAINLVKNEIANTNQQILEIAGGN